MAAESSTRASFEGQTAATRRWPAVLAAVAVLAGMGWLARPAVQEPPDLVVSEDPAVDITATPVVPVGPVFAGGTWSPLPAGTTGPRTRGTLLWADGRALLFGGQPDAGDNAGMILDEGGWTPMALSPMGSRTGHTAVWTGEEMIIFEGAPVGQAAAVAAQEIDGAAYRLSTDTWRPIADAPVNPRSGHVALWTGEEMLVFGGSRTFETNVPLAAYDPVADSWRLSSTSPLDRGFGLVAGVWTGEEAVFWTGGGPNDVAAYDPVTDTWRLLPPSPSGMRSVTATWTGEEMILLGIPAPGNEHVGGMALHLADERWTVLPPSPQAFAATHASVWTGESVVLIGGPAEQPGAVWTPGRARWEALPPGPQPALSGHSVTWTGESVLLWGGQGRDGIVGTAATFTPG